MSQMPQTKEMISYKKEGDKQKVKINFSSLDLINTCMRKTYYSLEQKLVSKEPNPALVFGTAIHKALEVWYLSDPKDRVIPKNAKERATQIALGISQESKDELMFQAIEGFIKEAAPIADIAPGEKRSITHGVNILVEYFKRYQDDGMEVMRDAEGNPLVEKTAEHVIYSKDNLEITYFGTVDVILQNKQTGVVAVADHKTTSSLGPQFYSRLKPNHQYTGYIWLANKALGIDTNLFMINGIQVAKTKIEFARQFTERTEEDYQELQASVIEAVMRYVLAKSSNNWTQNAPQPCTMYGSCSYLRVCEVNAQLRENVLNSLWDTKGAITV